MKRFHFALVALVSLLVTPAFADVRLPAVLGSHMVLQQGQPITIWGWAEPGEDVSVSFGKKISASTKAGADGKWKVKLPAMKVGKKPRSLTVSGKNEIQLNDILIGDVWVGSGQSNMEWSLSGSQNGRKAIATAKHPGIRLFHIPKKQQGTPADDVKANWVVCTPKSVPAFSGVLFFFGRRLQSELRVPIGLINSSWGGSRIEPWTIKDGNSGGMYNGMIAPIVPFAIRGATWYQGESNVSNGLAYFGKTKDLIEGWRKAWGRELPFYFVQIAPWGGYGSGQLPALWEAQVESLKIPKTGMAVTTDIVHNIGDIHPRNKIDVGERLARWALAKEYGKKGIIYSGPLYKSMKVDGKRIVLEFAHAKGLKSRDGKPLSEFQIANKDGEFVPALALIKGRTIIVQAKTIDKPARVRFGWHKVANPNLVNVVGLPASPFHTDGWRGGTGE
jgi:sialate O-acetylesterase